MKNTKKLQESRASETITKTTVVRAANYILCQLSS